MGAHYIPRWLLRSKKRYLYVRYWSTSLSAGHQKNLLFFNLSIVDFMADHEKLMIGCRYQTISPPYISRLMKTILLVSLFFEIIPSLVFFSHDSVTNVLFIFSSLLSSRVFIIRTICIVEFRGLYGVKNS